MKLDSHLVFALTCVFARASAMVLTAPLVGNVVPVMVRVLFSGVLSLSLVPVLQPHIGPLPDSVFGLVLSVGRELLIGLLIGGMLQLLVAAVQMAGAFIDVQIGVGSAQLLNPLLGTSTTPIGQFKAMLTVLLIVLLDGHRMMLMAFAKSFEWARPTVSHTQVEFLELIGRLSLLSLQIAAPIAAVTVVIDLAAGLINKAVPQTQPFLLSLPAKLIAGFVVLAIGLPALVKGVDAGLDTTFDHLGRMLRGR